MTCGDLRTPPPPSCLIQLSGERQFSLRGVPATRQLRGRGAAAVHFHPEAIEAQGFRTIDGRVVILAVAEPIPRLTFAARRAEPRLYGIGPHRIAATRPRRDPPIGFPAIKRQLHRHLSPSYDEHKQTL